DVAVRKSREGGPPRGVGLASSVLSDQWGRGVQARWIGTSATPERPSIGMEASSRITTCSVLGSGHSPLRTGSQLALDPLPISTLLLTGDPDRAQGQASPPPASLIGPRRAIELRLGIQTVNASPQMGFKIGTVRSGTLATLSSTTAVPRSPRRLVAASSICLVPTPV